MKYDIEAIKKIVKEDLTDSEAEELVRKLKFTHKAEMEGKPYLTFDWAKAIMLIFAHNIQNAEFGLIEDWDSSKAIGLHNGKPIPPTKESKFGYYLTSNWAKPTLYDIDNDKYYPCYVEVPSEKILQVGKGLWWPEDAKLSFDFVTEIMEDLQL